MPPVPIARGGLRGSKAPRASRWPRTRSGMSVVRSVDFGPQRAAHAEQSDEAFGLLYAPVGRLRVGRALCVQQARRRHRDRVDAATARLQHHLTVDALLAGSEERLQVGLEGIVEEAFVHQLHPLARDLRLETVLLLGQ